MQKKYIVRLTDAAKELLNQVVGRIDVPANLSDLCKPARANGRFSAGGR